MNSPSRESHIRASRKGKGGRIRYAVASELRSLLPHNETHKTFLKKMGVNKRLLAILASEMNPYEVASELG